MSWSERFLENRSRLELAMAEGFKSSGVGVVNDGSEYFMAVTAAVAVVVI